MPYKTLDRQTIPGTKWVIETGYSRKMIRVYLEHGNFSDNPFLSEGKAFYDFPNRIPVKVKKTVLRKLTEVEKINNYCREVIKEMVSENLLIKNQ